MSELLEGDESSTVEIVEIVNAVGDGIGVIHDQRLERAALRGETRARELEILGVGSVCAELVRSCRVLPAIPRVLEHGVQRSPREVETSVVLPVRREPGQDAERLCVALEAVHCAGVQRQPIQLLLRHMAERRVSEIMGKRSGLDHLRVQPTAFIHACGVVALQLLSDAAGDLRDFDGVREAVMEDVAFERTDHLRNAREAAER